MFIYEQQEWIGTDTRFDRAEELEELRFYPSLLRFDDFMDFFLSYCMI